MTVRQPAVAGLFYPAHPEALERDVRGYLPPDATSEKAFGAIVPHAGYVYSGPVAGAVYARMEIPRTVVIVCPNHTGHGAPAAMDPSDSWQTPLGEVPLARPLAQRLRELAPRVTEDSQAHRREHSLEVQLPFLKVLRPDVEIVPICLGEPSFSLCREVGEAFARAAGEEREAPLLLASSDMNHYESRAVGRAKDDLALERIEAIDPEGLFETVLGRSISMCGFLPATALLAAARAAGASRARVVSRRDSGDETGDISSVVGYAGVLVT